MPLKMQVVKKPYDMDTELDFGMYKGYRVRDVLEEDPSYLVWAYETIADFGLAEDIYWKAEEARDHSMEDEFNRNIIRIISEWPDPYDYCD